MLIGAGVTLAYADRHLVPASLTGWTVSNVSAQVVNAAVPVAAFVLASRRPENRIGWLFLVAGLALGLSGLSDQYALHALVADPGSWPAGRAAGWLFNVVWMIPVAMLAFVFLLFPTGYVRSRRWRLAGWFIGGAFTLANVWLLIVATRLWARPFTSPFIQAGSPVGSPVLYLMTAVLISTALLVSVAAVVVRFAKSSGEERLQLKWCAAAALVLVVVFAASIWVNSAAVNVLQSLAFSFLWTAIAIAVLKYRLYDIDRLISRTLAYAIVTGLLIGVYAGLVLLATQVLTVKSPVAVAGSTLVMADAPDRDRFCFPCPSPIIVRSVASGSLNDAGEVSTLSVAEAGRAATGVEIWSVVAYGLVMVMSELPDPGSVSYTHLTLPTKA